MEPTPEDFRKFCQAVLSWVGPLLIARQSTATVQRKDVDEAEWDTDFMREAKAVVTSVDYESQSMILEQLAKIYPGHSVLFEEEDSQWAQQFADDSKYVWMIDPLDGTANYAKGSELFGAICGVARRDTRRVIAGAIIEPVAGKAFSFAAGGGAKKGFPQFNISKPKADAPILVGGQVPEALIAAIEAEGYKTLRAYGCIVAATTRLLEGEAGAYLFNNSDRLDAAVPMALVEAARGKVADWEGKPLKDWLRPRFHTVIASGDPVLFEELLMITEEHVPPVS